MTMVEWNMPWLLLLAVQPLVISLLRKYFEKKRIKNYVKKELQAWVIVHTPPSLKNKHLLRNIFYYLAWLLFAIAAAGPRIAEQVPSGLNNHGKDIMIVVDISQSMQATDLTPSRLHHAYKKINYLIDTMSGNRIGIITYAAKPHLYVPLTHDKNVLRFYLKNLMFLVPPSQGSRPLSALKLASQQLNSKELPNNQRTKSILLITDADSIEAENTKLDESSTYFVKRNTPIFTMIVASDKGEAIPAFKDGWISINGRPVISRPQIKIYQSLSDNTHGILKRVSSDYSSMNSIIDNINSLTEPSNNIATQTNWNELYYLFLFPAVLLLFINMFTYTLARKVFLSNIAPAINLMLIFVGILVMTFVSSSLYANQSDEINNAYQALIKQDYVKAREIYSELNNFDGRFGEAVSSYRLSDYPRAIRLFEQAVLLAQSPKQFSKTLYNLANSYFQTGNYALAISNFKAALLYQPTHQSSLKNLEYSEKALLAIAERKKLLAITKRSGRGPRSARAADDVVISENSSVSLDDSESLSSNTNNVYINKKIDIPEFIILRGLAFAKDAQNTRQSTNSNGEKHLTKLNLSQLNKLLDNQSTLWRRIFEIEEGYPAPLDEPESLPGVLPW